MDMKIYLMELHREIMNYIDKAPREIHFTIEQKRYISKIFGKIKKDFVTNEKKI